MLVSLLLSINMAVKGLLRIGLILLVVAVLVSELVDARRGGGGGGRGGGRGGSRGGSRGGRGSSRSSSRSRTGFLGSKAATKAAIAAGAIYGARSWRRRSIHYHDPDRVPTACYNDKYKTNEYGNITYYGRFICPQDGQEDDMEYCCGEEGEQKCCAFFDDAGRTAGVVIGVLVAFIVIGLIIFCCCKRRGKSTGKTLRPSSSKAGAGQDVSAAVPLNVMTQPNKAEPAQSYPMATPYQPPMDPFTAPPANPPSYNAAVSDSVGYDANNTAVPPVGYQPPPTGYPPQPMYPGYGQQALPTGPDMTKAPLPPGDMSGSSYPPGATGLPYGLQPPQDNMPTGSTEATPYDPQPYPPTGFDSQGATPYPAQPYPGAYPPAAQPGYPPQPGLESQGTTPYPPKT